MKPITVCSLRDRGEPMPDDVVCTRPGLWGNPFTAKRYGWRALDLYRDVLVRSFETDLGGAAAIKALPGKRLLCACPSDALACHAWILAAEVSRLTGCGVIPAPGRERP